MSTEEPAWKAELRDQIHERLRAYGEGDEDPGTGYDYGDQTAIAMATMAPHIQAAEQRGRREAAEKIRRLMHDHSGSYDASRWNRVVGLCADLIDPPEAESP